LITSEFEVLASSLRFMAASAFVSDERVLNVGIGAAQLRLANLVQGDWLSGASQVAYQGGIDHLMRAVPFDDLPGTSRLVWVQFVDPVYPDRADQDTEGIVKFSLSSTTQLGSSGSWMLRRSGRRAGKCSLRKYSKWRRPGWLRARGQTAGSGGCTGSVCSPAWRLAEPGEAVGETRPGPGAATGRSQVPAARHKIGGTRGLDLAGHPLTKAGVR
jgi:hypothetical protein